MNKLSTVVYGVITLVVVVILISTIAIPVIEDAQKERYTALQNTDGRYTSAVSNDLSMDIVWDSSNQKISFGDKAFDVTFGSIVTIFYSDSLLLRIATSNIQLSDMKNDIHKVDMSTLTDSKITIENGAYTYSISSSTYTGTIASSALFLDDEGNYGVYTDVLLSSNLYANDDSVIYALIENGTDSQSRDVYVGFSGTVKDSLSSTFAYVYADSKFNEATATVTNWTPVLEDKGYYKIGSVTAGVNYDDVSSTIGMKTYFIPIEYTYISENDNMIIMLLGVIPLMLAIIPVMLAVQLITGSRRD